MSEAIRNIGTILTFTDATPPSGVVAELTDLGEISMSRDTIDVTNYDSADGVREFISGLADGGEVSIAGNFIAADLGQVYMKAAFDDGEIEEVEIEFSDGSTCTFDCLVTGYGVTAGAVGGKVGFTGKLKISGSPVWA